jgi:ubiquinone biosynthesis protein UbiJ
MLNFGLAMSESLQNDDLEGLLASCVSEAERLAILKQRLSKMRQEIDLQKSTAESFGERLRIKERQLIVQTEENDRLSHNYENLKKRMMKL